MAEKFTPSMPMASYLRLKIGKNSYDFKHPDHLQSLNVTRALEAFGTFDFTIVDIKDYELEAKLVQAIKDIEKEPLLFEFGWANGEMSPTYRGRILTYSADFLSNNNISFTVTGVTTSEGSKPKTKTYKGNSMDEIILQVANTEGWKVGKVVKCKKWDSKREFHQNNVSSIAFLRKLVKEAISTKGLPVRVYHSVSNTDGTSQVSTVVPKKSSTSYTNYKIVWGDTLSEIAQRFNTTVSAIQKANSSKIKNVNLIYAGDTIKIPQKSSSGGSTTTYTESKISVGDPMIEMYEVDMSDPTKIKKSFNFIINSGNYGNVVSFSPDFDGAAIAHTDMDVSYVNKDTGENYIYYMHGEDADLSLKKKKITKTEQVTSTEHFSYKIVWGDTLTALARRFNTTIKAIQQANSKKIKNVDLIYAGDTIRIPKKVKKTVSTTQTITTKGVNQSHRKKNEILPSMQGPTTPDRMEAIIKNQWSQENSYGYRATLTVVGMPSIQPLDYINIIPMRPDGKIHHTSGTYLVLKVTDNVLNSYQTNLELVRATEEYFGEITSVVADRLTGKTSTSGDTLVSNDSIIMRE